MKTVTLTVELTFSKSITDYDEVNEGATNVIESLAHTVQTAGMAPEWTEAYTKSIRVINPGTDINLFFNLNN